MQDDAHKAKNSFVRGIYVGLDGRSPFTEWLERLKNRSTRYRIKERLDRVALGNLGGWKMLKDGICELKLYFGGGYRIYFGQDGEETIVLLMGRDKSTQQQDIRRAKKCWLDYLRGVVMNKRAKSRDYQEYLLETLKDSDEAKGYLNAALEGGDIDVFLLALRNVINARGGVKQVAEQSKKSRTSLYKTLSVGGNPYLKNTNEILSFIGMHLFVEIVGQKTGGRKRVYDNVRMQK